MSTHDLNETSRFGDHPRAGCSPDNCAICQDLLLHETPTEAAARNCRKTDQIVRQLRTANGRSRNLQFRTTEPSPQVRAAWAARFAQELAGCPAPDPYRAAIEKRQKDAATPASKFEDTYKAARHREYAAEHARHAARTAARSTPRLNEAEVKTYPSPDIYGPGLKALAATMKKEKSR